MHSMLDGEIFKDITLKTVLSKWEIFNALIKKFLIKNNEPLFVTTQPQPTQKYCSEPLEVHVILP